MAFTFDPLFAQDPNNPNTVAKDGVLTLFDPADPTKAPITITDPTGSPLPNPITVDAFGMGPAFQHPTLERVGWFGAGFTNYLTSYEGMKKVATDAKDAAQAAAATAGAEAAAVATAAIGTATGAATEAATRANAAATAAANSAALVGAPADAAIAAAVNGTGATKAALSATIGEQVRPLKRNAAQIARATTEKLSGVKVVIIIRHDDGQLPQMDYLSIYEKHGNKGSFVIVPTFIDQPNYFTKTQLHQVFNAGHDIGSHTMTHPQANAYTQTEAERRYELGASKAWLEAELGNGYVCEHVTYPGNQPAYNNELFEYYLAGFGDGAAPTLNGPVDLADHPASIGLDWFDNASSAANKTKINNRIATLKAQGSAVEVIQVHNFTEGTPTQLDELFTIIDADPEVITLTLTEWMHYVRETFTVGINKRNYWKGNKNPGLSVVEWNSATASTAAFAANRTGAGGAGFKAMVNGTVVATLDTVLAMLGAGTSRFEKGHRIEQYSSDNVKKITADVSAGGVWHVIGTGMTYLLTNGFGVWARRDGQALQAQNAASVEKFTVDTTRGTIYLAPLSALPTGTSRVGEECNVNGVWYACTVAGNPGTWVVKGSQT
jgi:peptidoglycan/xylan/chitin deacetylase (PgdA/CDA1 family)